MGLFGRVIAAVALSWALVGPAGAQLAPPNPRLYRLPVVQFVVVAALSVQRQEGTLILPLETAAFDGTGAILDRPAGFPEELLGRTVISRRDWEQFARLGSDVLANFERFGPVYVTFGEEYQEVRLNEERGDFVFGRPVNLSTRGRVGPGADVLIAGFVVRDGPARVLIRGIGPSLTAFGVPDALPDPFVTLRQGTVPLRFNDNWSDGRSAEELSTLVDTSARVGAFPLSVGSRDAVILEELTPGSYTVVLEGIGAPSGVALIEVYVVPGP